MRLDRAYVPTVLPPGQNVVVTAKGATMSLAAGAPLLLWRLNFGPEREAKFAPSPGGGGGGGATFLATIPLTGAQEGDLLRWRLRVAPGVYDPPEQQQEQQKQQASNSTQQQPQRYVGALLSSSPSARTPAPPPLEASTSSAANLASLASPLLPEIHWWAPNEAAAISDAGSPGSVLYLPPLPGSPQGAVYDAVHSERRGVTALAWKKPKLKFSLPQGAAERFLVAYAPEKGTRALRLNSYHAELGDGPSLMREVVALAVLREAGVAAPLTHYVRVFLNGRVLGLFGVIEGVDDAFLDRRALHSGPDAPLFEAVSGEQSNLRGDLPAAELASAYGKTGDPSSAADWRQLDLLVKGLAGAGAPGDTGGGASPSSNLLGRRLFLLDAANLPAVVNEAAAQTILGNMDRCTKNFYVYRDPRALQWQRFPWDVEAAFGQDNGLGGRPGELYAVLAGEQWSSPLYCDAQHPQDVEAAARPGLNTYFGSARGAARESSSRPSPPQQQQRSASPSSSSSSSLAVGATAAAAAGGPPGQSGGRRLQQQQRLLAEGPPLQPGAWPEPTGWADPDAVPPGLALVRIGASPGTPAPRRGSGAAFTYNHLTAALLDVPETRAMYLRRLRTLADIYYGGGGGTPPSSNNDNNNPSPRLELLVKAVWSSIQPAAQEDARLWARPDPARGVQQILTEYVPIRARQLLRTYAPGGVRPLLPSSSAAGAGGGAVRLARFEDDGGGGGPGGFLEIRNDADASGGAEAAVDASGWEVRSGGQAWRLPPGLVVPPGRSVFLARDAAAFRARGTSPRGGEGNIVVPVFSSAPGAIGGPPGAAVGPGPLPSGGGGWELVDANSGAVVSAL